MPVSITNESVNVNFLMIAVNFLSSIVGSIIIILKHIRNNWGKHLFYQLNDSDLLFARA